MLSRVVCGRLQGTRRRDKIFEQKQAEGTGASVRRGFVQAACVRMKVQERNMDKKPYFPMYVDMSDKKVLVVGAGTIAKRRIRMLLDFAGEVTVLAPEINPELAELEKAGKLTVLRKKYEREDLFGMDLVVAASPDPGVNSDIYAACKCLGILVNVPSDKQKCDFYFPRIIHDENVVIGISSGGIDPKAARKTAENIEKALNRK